MKGKKLKDLTLEEIKIFCDSREKKCDGCEFSVDGSNCFVFRLSQNKLNDTIKLSKRYIPKQGERYYYVDDKGNILNTCWSNHNIDIYRYNFNNCFKTANEIKFKLEQIKVYNELNNFALENNDEKIRWGNNNQSKFMILYNHIRNELTPSEYSYVQFLGGVYFTSAELARQAIKVVGEERLKKYLFEKN